MSGRLVRDDVNGKGHLRVSRQERTVLRQSPWCRNVVVVPSLQCWMCVALSVLLVAAQPAVLDVVRSSVCFMLQQLLRE